MINDVYSIRQHYFQKVQLFLKIIRNFNEPQLTEGGFENIWEKFPSDRRKEARRGHPPCMGIQYWLGIQVFIHTVLFIRTGWPSIQYVHSYSTGCLYSMYGHTGCTYIHTGHTYSCIDRQYWLSIQYWTYVHTVRLYTVHSSTSLDYCTSVQSNMSP